MPRSKTKTPPPKSGGLGRSTAHTPSPSDVARHSISEIIENERVMREDCERAERIIQRVTRLSGSVHFIAIHAIWFALWIILNTALPARLRWDPFPFTFLTLVVSLEAIFLSTFILVTENREAAVAERRMHLDLQINLLAEQENTRMLVLVNRIAEHLGVPLSEDAETKALAKKTEPGRILDQIDQCLKKSGPAADAAHTPKS
jgi:uncharacterized membrane protein